MQFDHKDIHDYMESLATAHVDIQGFYRMDISEIMGKMRSGIKYPAMAIESMEGDFAGSKPNNTNGTNLFAFTILKRPRPNDTEEQNQFLNDCLVIGIEVMARLRKDSKTPSHFLHNNLMLEDVKYGKIGPLYADMLYGYRFEVPLQQKINLRVNIDKWHDITDDC